MPDYPTGTVTLVFTDLENSSELSGKHGAAFEPHRDRHFELLRLAAANWDGFEVETAGDSLFVVFAFAFHATQFAIEAQRAMREYSWPEEIGELRVRIGMHTGEPFIGIDNGRPTYRGPATNKAARVQAAGHGGQILLSQAAFEAAHASLSREITLQDLGRHRLKGVGEEHFWQASAPGLSDEFRALNTLPASRHNLPLPQTPFVGREDEIQNCIQLLRSGSTRLLTLLAFGGMGKTRTALQIAELSFDDFQDGVWWIELENARSGDEMASRIAEALRLHLQPQPGVREQVCQWLQDRQILLVLDNLEQVQGDEAAQVVHEFLNAGPRVKCLITSRRSLNLSSEQIVELAPLSFSEAQNLFAGRARGRKANFEINDQNRADVEAICRTLEGVPLAIEIAASLIVLLAPKQILKKLDDQLRVLVTRDPARPRRQQAVRAAIDWSHDLLPADAKKLFAQLSVFAGGFGVEAAEAVCQCFEGDVMDSLLELRNHSLLRAQSSETQQERLTMLESVRTYARENLQQDAAQAENSLRLHAHYFLEFLEEQTQSLRTRNEADALYEMEAEFDNFRAALGWAQENDAGVCARLALAFHRPLHARGFWSEARDVLEIGWSAAQELEIKAEGGAPGVLQPGVLQAGLCHYRAALAHDMGEENLARELAVENLKLWQKLENATGIADALNLLGLLATENDESEHAQQLCEEALENWPISDAGGRAKTLHNMARLAARSGDCEKARRLYEECLTQRKRAGDARGEAETLGNMGVLAQERGDIQRAREFYVLSLKLRRELRDRSGIAMMLFNLAELAELENDMPRALTLYVHAGRIFSELQSPYVSAPADAMQKMSEALGDGEYSRLYADAECSAWEEFC